MWWRIQFKKPPMWNFSTVSCSPSLFLGPNTFLRTLFSKTLDVCSSLIVRDQVSRSHKNTENLFRNWIDFSRVVLSRRVDTWSHSSTKICNYPAISSNEKRLCSQNASPFGYSLRSVLIKNRLTFLGNAYLYNSFKNIDRDGNAGI